MRENTKWALDIMSRDIDSTLSRMTRGDHLTPDEKLDVFAGIHAAMSYKLGELEAVMVKQMKAKRNDVVKEREKTMKTGYNSVKES